MPADDGRFLDGGTVDDLPRPVEVVATDGQRPARRRPRETHAATLDLPAVAVVGRPNVGKSTLFNRIVGEQAAIVEDRPGITRDRKEPEAEWLGVPFRIIDTGGWLPGGTRPRRQGQPPGRGRRARRRRRAVRRRRVRRHHRRRRGDRRLAAPRPPDVLVVANKADNDRREDERWEFLALGLGEPYPVSALHGRRAGDLLDVVVARFPRRRRRRRRATTADARRRRRRRPWTPDEPRPPRVAIVGRPNVGKSTLFNRLVGEDRSVVHDMAGTTRDAIDTLVETEDGPIVFVDTAGMRRRSRIDDSAEYYSLVRALRAIDDADIALLVIDATEGVTGQDQRLAERVDAAGCPIVVMLNKWELIDDPDERLGDARRAVARKLAFIGDAPVLKISALTGKGVHKLRPVLQEAITQYHRRVPTRDVNRVLADAQQRQPAGRRGQGAVRRAGRDATRRRSPCSSTASCPQTYLRYLERAIREAFEFGSTPLKLRVREAHRSDAMPWCDDCAKYWAPSAMTPEGDLPDVRRRPRDAGDLAGSARPSDEKAPWHFKLLVVALVVYLGYRFFEMFFA